MADVKISALPAASTPLTGAEVLPIVQSSVTTKVAVSNLTAGLAGTASININGTVGATTPTTGAFTSGTFSTTLGVTGTSTLAALSATTGTFSGLITSTVGNSSSILTAATATTGYILFSDIKNTGGRFQFGVDSSVGGQLATGSTAYATVLTTVGTTPIILGTNSIPRITIDSAGAVTMPAQPAFLATANTQTDVTGDGTTYTVLFANEIFDQGSNFASNTFTAPVTGRYFLSARISFYGLLVGHTFQLFSIVTSNRSYRTLNSVATNSFTENGMGVSVLADMDAGDTATVQLEIAGSTKVVDIDAAAYTDFSGHLAC